MKTLSNSRKVARDAAAKEINNGRASHDIKQKQVGVCKCRKALFAVVDYTSGVYRYISDPEGYKCASCGAVLSADEVRLRLKVA